MILAARTPAPPCQTHLVNEAEAEAGEEEGAVEYPPAGDVGVPVSEGHVPGAAEEELVEPWLPLLQHRQLPPPHQLLPTRRTASPSKGQALRIRLHLPRGPVQWHLVPVVLSCRGMATSVIPWRGMTARQPGIHLFRAQRTARRDPHLRRPRA